MSEALLPLAAVPGTPVPQQRVAEVLIEVPLAHLDRPFEYLLADDQAAVPGCRVAVRFSGAEREGFVLALKEGANHAGRLSTVRRVISPEPVLTPQVLAAAQDIGRRFAAPVSDAVRLAVPRRHARAEKALTERPPAEPGPLPDAATAAWERYAAGPALLERLAAGQSIAATVLAAPAAGPGTSALDLVAQAVRAVVDGGRGAVVVVPDERDVVRLDGALVSTLGTGRHVALTASLGPQARYTAWLKVLRGHVPVAVGTRAAAWAPVRDLGLVVWWDDGDDNHREPRSPYAPTREVLAARARAEGAALLHVGYALSSTMAAWAEDGVPGLAGPFPVLALDRGEVRARTPRVRLSGDVAPGQDPAAAHARLPEPAMRDARRALEVGPVLVQVPRAGYVPGLRCARCRTPARCSACSGPLALVGAQAAPACRWCGRTHLAYTCTECGTSRLRAGVRGSGRTAEELGRAFPGTRVIASGGDRVVDQVDASPALVVATPGAEPVAEGGYAAALLLDAWALLDLPGLEGGEEALRRWLAAAALVRPGSPVWVAGAPDDRPDTLDCLVRWDPARLAHRELAERRALRLPPAVRLAELRGDRGAVGDALQWLAREAAEVEVLGPLEVRPVPGVRPSAAGPLLRALLRVDLAEGEGLARTVKALRSVRSAAKAGGELLARMDPDVEL